MKSFDLSNSERNQINALYQKARQTCLFDF